MGYSCPVCDDPQADGSHLANHLAFTAMIRGGDHEAWLDEHVPGWSELGEEELAGEVTDEAERTEYPQVFEDTTGQHAHDHSEDAHADDRNGMESGTDGDPLPPGTSVPEPSFDDDTADIVREAQELTRERRERADGADDHTDGDGDSETE